MKFEKYKGHTICKLKKNQAQDGYRYRAFVFGDEMDDVELGIRSHTTYIAKSKRKAKQIIKKHIKANK